VEIVIASLLTQDMTTARRPAPDRINALNFGLYRPQPVGIRRELAEEWEAQT
jgi:hypothetical protein